jgi:hypothetical protein
MEKANHEYRVPTKRGNAMTQEQIFEQATQQEIIDMDDQEVLKLACDLTNDRNDMLKQIGEVEKLLSMINIRDRVKAAGRAA